MSTSRATPREARRAGASSPGTAIAWFLPSLRLVRALAARRCAWFARSKRALGAARRAMQAPSYYLSRYVARSAPSRGFEPRERDGCGPLSHSAHGLAESSLGSRVQNARSALRGAPCRRLRYYLSRYAREARRAGGFEPRERDRLVLALARLVRALAARRCAWFARSKRALGAARRAMQALAQIPLKVIRTGAHRIGTSLWVGSAHHPEWLA
jgi:hypothetical protein